MDVLLFAAPIAAVLLLVGLALMAELEREETVVITLPRTVARETRGRLSALPADRRPAADRQRPSRSRRIAATSAHAP